MRSVQTLAIWGAPGAGKTVTAVKLALELAAHKKNTMILMCDFTAPAPQTLQPKIPTDGKSLGALLTLPAISQDVILAHNIPVGSNPYISLLGYQRGDNSFTYAQYSKERAVDLITMLGHLADYILIDVSSIFSFDVLSAAALENADAVLRLCNCDLKSMSYMAANLPLLSDGRFASGKHIRVLSAAKPGQDSGEYNNAYGGATYTLPYVPELEEQFYSALLMDELCTIAAKRYKQVIKKIASDLLLNSAEEAPAEKRVLFTRKEKDSATSAEFRRSSEIEEKTKLIDRLFKPKAPKIEDSDILNKWLRKGGKR